MVEIQKLRYLNYPPPYFVTESKIKKGYNGIWQRRYYEHTIIDENDLYKHLDYIHYNPVKHKYVKSAKEWDYSSFSKIVKLGMYEKDWCNLEDKNHSKSLDLD